jgi:type III secretion protein T
MDELLAQGLPGLSAWLLSSIRFFMVSLFLPFLRKQVLVGLVQTGVVLCLGAMVAPSVWPHLPTPMSMTFWLPVVVKEMFIGLLMGFMVGAPFWIIDSLGVIIDQQTGSSQAGVMDPLSGHPTGPSSFFMTYSIAGLMVASGIFLVIIGAVFDTYVIWPVLASLPTLPPDFSWLFAQEFGRQYALLGVLMLPFVVVLVFIEFVVGFFGKALSALDGHSFAQGLKQLAAQGLLMVLLVIMLARLLEYMAAFPLVKGLRELLGG